MKRILTLLAMLAMFLGIAQAERPIRVDLIAVDTVTTAERDAIPADPAKAQYVYHITANQLEERKPGGSWAAFGSTADGSETIVQATSPITISGTGTVGSPYQVGFNGNGYLPLSGGLANEMTGDLHMGNNFIAGLNKVNWDAQDPNPDGVRNMWYNGTTDRFTVRDENNSVEELAYESELATAGTDDQTAAEVTIADSGGNYTATNVEDALDEALSKDDDAVEISTSGSRTNYTPASQNVEAELAAIDAVLGAESNTPYRESIAEGTTLSSRSYDVGQYGRIDLNTSSSSAITVNFTNKTNAIGEPIALHIYTTNAGGTTFTFDAETFDNQDTGAFSVVLAQNEERTLHFVVAQATVVRCTNFPVGSGGGADNSLSEADQPISVADRTINLSGVSSVLNIENGSGSDITRFTKTGLEISAIENIGTLTDPMVFGSPFQIYNNGAGGTTTVTSPLEGTVLWDGPTEEFRLYHDSAWLTMYSPTNLNSTTVGEPTGFASITNIGTISKSDLEAGTAVNGTHYIVTGVTPAEVVTSATIDMNGRVMLDDQTADNATLTFQNLEAGGSATVYINRATAPTLAGTGVTFNALPNTTAFAAGTEMAIYFEVAYDGSTIDYYYYER